MHQSLSYRSVSFSGDFVPTATIRTVGRMSRAAFPAFVSTMAFALFHQYRDSGGVEEAWSWAYYGVAVSILGYAIVKQTLRAAIHFELCMSHLMTINCGAAGMATTFAAATMCVPAFVVALTLLVASGITVVAALRPKACRARGFTHDL